MLEATATVVEGADGGRSVHPTPHPVIIVGRWFSLCSDQQAAYLVGVGIITSLIGQSCHLARLIPCLAGSR